MSDYAIKDRQAPPGNGLVAIVVGVGFAMVIVGSPLAWAVRYAVGGGRSPVFSAILLLLGIALSLNYTAIRQGVLLARKEEVAPVFIPLFCFAVLSMAAVSDLSRDFDGTSRGVSGLDVRQLIDTCVMLLFAVALFSQPLRHFDKLPAIVAIIGAFTAILTIAFAFSSLETFAEFMTMGRLGGVGDDTDSGSPFTVTKIGAVTMVAALLWKRQSRNPSVPKTVFVSVAFVAGVLTILFGRARTVWLGLVLLGGFLLVIWAIRKRLFPKPKKRVVSGITRRGLAIAVVFVAVIGFTLVEYSDYLLVLFDKTFSTLLGGAGTYVGGGTADASALMRRISFHRTVDYFSVWGQGFEAMFADDPVLTAFYDLGLFGGAAFFFVTLILPIRICFDIYVRGWTLSPGGQFAMAFYVLSCPNLFLAVMPYTISNWYPIITFYAIVGRDWNSRMRGIATSGQRPNESLALFAMR